MIAPGTYHECAIQQAGHITFKAAVPGRVIFEQTACEGKAALVLRGTGSTVDGIVFRGFKVDDGNGAGIRIESGPLVVRNSMFLDSQEGIIGGSGTDIPITIDHTTFSGLGQCDQSPSCAHSVYFETKGLVTITNSRFRAWARRGITSRCAGRAFRSPTTASTIPPAQDQLYDRPAQRCDRADPGQPPSCRAATRRTGPASSWSPPKCASRARRGCASLGNTASLARGETRSPAFVADYSHERLAIGDNRLGKGVRAFETR